MSRIVSFLSSQLLTSATLALIAGILLARTHSLDRDSLVIPSLILLCLAILLGLRLLRKPTYWHLPLTLLLLIGLGWLHMQHQSQLPADPSHIYNLTKEPKEAVVVGKIATMPENRNGLVGSELTLTSIRFADQQHWQTAKGLLGFRLKGIWPADLLPGDQVAIRLTLKRPRPLASPGSFDTATWLARQGIWVTGFVSSPLHLHKVDTNTPWWQQVRYLPERWRSLLAQFIDRALQPDTAGLYRAILIGDKSGLTDQTEENFKKAGLAHILVISGVHLTILGGAMFATFLFLLRRSEWFMLRFPIRQLAAVLSLPILILYATLAGLNPPVLRSLLMSLVVLVALCSLRNKNVSTLISGVLLVMLLLNPHQLFEASLQLSFVATIAILWLLSQLSNHWNRIEHQKSIWRGSVRWGLTALAVSSAAAIATGPISLYYFHRVSLVGPISNLLVEPLVCLWSLTLGFLAVLVFPLAEPCSSLLLQTGALGLKLATTVTATLADLPFSHRWLASPTLPAILICYAGMTTMALALSRPGKQRLCGLLLGFLLTIPAFSNAITGPWHPVQSPTLRLVSLDVGHGSATLLQLPDNRTILIDGGGPALSASSVGERIIAPYLWHAGVSSLDSVVITHPDGDHYNGLSFIFAHFPVKQLWISGQQGHNRDYQELLTEARRHGTEVIVPTSGAIIRYSRLIALRNVAAAPGTRNVPNVSGSNNQGLVVRVEAAGLGILFPGDLEREREQILLNENADQLPSQVMLAAHHGSKTSNSQEFLQQVAPSILLVSAGAGRDRGFPAPALIAWCKEQGILLGNTADLGTIELHWLAPELSVWHYGRVNDNPLLPLRRQLLARHTLTGGES